MESSWKATEAKKKDISTNSMPGMFKVGAFAIILDEQDRVLLGHRRDCDLWNLPGGGLEEREAPWQGVIREVQEEVGLQVQVERLAGVYSKPDDDEIVFTFVCREVGGAVTTSDEADGIQYFHANQLPMNVALNHIERIKDALAGSKLPLLKVQRGPSSADLMKRRESGLRFHDYEVLSFDCYGTLIDWESGILAALRPVVSNHGINWSDEQILAFYAEAEPRAEAGDYVKYRDVLRRVMRELGRRLGFAPSASELNCLVDSLNAWPPFPDTVEALRTLKKAYKLAIISNVDDDLFALSARHLGVKFDWVITAQQAKAYKPSLRNFTLALERMSVPPSKVLHIAQSLYHDIVPARRLGLSTVWINRRRGKQGLGATPPANVQPDLEVADLGSLVSIMGFNQR